MDVPNSGFGSGKTPISADIPSVVFCQELVLRLSHYLPSMVEMLPQEPPQAFSLWKTDFPKLGLSVIRRLPHRL